MNVQDAIGTVAESIETGVEVIDILKGTTETVDTSEGKIENTYTLMGDVKDALAEIEATLAELLGSDNEQVGILGTATAQAEKVQESAAASKRQINEIKDYVLKAVESIRSTQVELEHLREVLESIQ